MNETPFPNNNVSDALSEALAATADFDANAGLSLAEKQRWRETLEKFLAESDGDTAEDQQNRADLLTRLGDFAREMADYAAAKAYFTRAVEISEALHGAEHPAVAAAIRNLGHILYDADDLKGATTAYERALRINEANYGYEHPEVAQDFCNLGSVLLKMDNLDGAKTHLERALQINGKAFGPEHPTVAVDLYNVAAVLELLGDLDGAKAHLERAISLFHRFGGEDYLEMQYAEELLQWVLAKIAAAEK